jgi:hypothetical protein
MQRVGTSTYLYINCASTKGTAAIKSMNRIVCIAGLKELHKCKALCTRIVIVSHRNVNAADFAILSKLVVHFTLADIAGKAIDIQDAAATTFATVAIRTTPTMVTVTVTVTISTAATITITVATVATVTGFVTITTVRRVVSAGRV